MLGFQRIMFDLRMPRRTGLRFYWPASSRWPIYERSAELTPGFKAVGPVLGSVGGPKRTFTGAFRTTGEHSLKATLFKNCSVTRSCNSEKGGGAARTVSSPHA